MVTKIPKKIKVSPFVLTVTDNPAFLGMVEAAALLNMKQQEVKLDFSQAHGYIRDSLLHELLHAIWQTTSLYDLTDVGFKHEEDVMRALTPKLLALLQDNPQLVTWFCEKEI